MLVCVCVCVSVCVCLRAHTLRIFCGQEFAPYRYFNYYFLLTVVHALNYMHVLIIIFCSQSSIRSATCMCTTTCMCTIVSMHSDTKTEI